MSDAEWQTASKEMIEGAIAGGAAGKTTDFPSGRIVQTPGGSCPNARISTGRCQGRKRPRRAVFPELRMARCRSNSERMPKVGLSGPRIAERSRRGPARRSDQSALSSRNANLQASNASRECER
jgi:hypothetical protein